MALSSPLLPQSAALFVLMVTRIGTMLLFMPGFSGRGVPAQVKLVAALVLALVLVPFIHPAATGLTQPARFFVAAAQELLVGLLLGLGIGVVFAAIEMASTLIGTQMGLNLSAVFSPLSGTTEMPLNTFYLATAALVFFGANGHHLVLIALQRSFEAVPVGAATVGTSAGSTMAGLVATMFGDALRIGLPIVGTLLIVDIALGILNRMVPQMNVFFVGMPAKAFVGFALVLATLPLLVRLLTPMVTTGIFDAMSRAGSVTR